MIIIKKFSDKVLEPSNIKIYWTDGLMFIIGSPTTFFEAMVYIMFNKSRMKYIFEFSSHHNVYRYLAQENVYIYI